MRRIRARHLDNERGMLLVVTLVVLLVLSTLAAANLINSFLERSLARNQNYTSIAQNAADAGMARGIAWLNDTALGGATGVIKRPGDPGYTPAWSTSLNGTLGNVGAATGAGTYDANAPSAATWATTLRFKIDTTDIDQDGDTSEAVLYNRCSPPTNGCFGYSESSYNTAGTGWPVIVVTSDGAYGAGAFRRIEMEIARDKFDVQAKGGVTASSSVQTSGNITIDGTSHDINGNPGGSCNESLPGISLPCPPTDVDGDCVCDVADGDVCYSYDQQGSSSSAGSPDGDELSNTNPVNSPDEALGLDPGDIATRIGGLPPANSSKVATSGNTTISYYNMNANIAKTDVSNGIVIVHNPLFEPLKWERSDPANGLKYPTGLTCAEKLALGDPYYDVRLDSGCAGSGYDAAFRTSAAPRVLDFNSNDTFKGVIIADKVDKINGNADIIGAIFSLTTVAIDTFGNGSARILYSCDAISSFTDVGFSIKLSWHRVYTD